MAYFHCLIGGGSSGGGYELTVTCDADFAGTTITCTDGVITLTQTCPSASPYEVVFEIPNGGDWTISGVVGGYTVSTGVNIPTSASLIATIQQTVTIHSAKEDTISYTDIDGATQTITFASGATSKQVQIMIEPNGSLITFTSSVAKNPDNLSQDYSKTFTITASTTDIYLMPDAVKTLYWWGYENTTIEVSNTGYGGQSKVQPTLNKNTNNFSASVGNNQEGSIGFYPLNFDASSISKINMIIDSLSMSSQYGQFGYGYTADGSTKPVRDGQHWGVSPNPTSNLKWSDTNIPTSSQKALWLWLYMGQNATISAMWYE